MKRLSLFAVFAAVMLAVAWPSAMIPASVTIDTGALEGVTGTVHPTVRIFKGIPFAAPPLGENRWKAPQPAAKWTGVRKADAFGPSCVANGGAAERIRYFNIAIDPLHLHLAVTIRQILIAHEIPGGDAAVPVIQFDG